MLFNVVCFLSLGVGVWIVSCVVGVLGVVLSV